MAFIQLTDSLGGALQVGPDTVMALGTVPAYIVAAASTYVVLEGNVRKIATGTPAANAATLGLANFVPFTDINGEDTWLISPDFVMSLEETPAAFLQGQAIGTTIALHGNVQIIAAIDPVDALVDFDAADSAFEGSYTPTLTNTTNVNVPGSNIPADCFRWIRIGDRVFVSGFLEILPTAALVTSFAFDLPIPSALTLAQQVGGSVTAHNMTTNVGTGGALAAEPVLNTGFASFLAGAANSHTVGFSFSYIVV